MRPLLFLNILLCFSANCDHIASTPTSRFISRGIVLKKEEDGKSYLLINIMADSQPDGQNVEGGVEAVKDVIAIALEPQKYLAGQCVPASNNGKSFFLLPLDVNNKELEVVFLASQTELDSAMSSKTKSMPQALMPTKRFLESNP